MYLPVWSVCVSNMLSLWVQNFVGSVDNSDAVLCVKLAASYGRANGGLCGSVGSSTPFVDPGSLVGAADLTPATTRGKSHTLSPLKDTLRCRQTLIVLIISHNLFVDNCFKHCSSFFVSRLVGG